MNTKNLGWIAGIIIVAALGFAAWKTPTQKRPAPTPAVPATNTPAQPASPSTQTEPGQNEVETFTVAEVATHNTSANCYAIVSGKVYNLTDWIAKHPGGPEAIKGLCGTDATAQFSAQHGSDKQPNNALAMFLIGEVVK